MRNDSWLHEIVGPFWQHRPSALFILLSVANAMAQTAPRPANFDIRALPLALGPAAPSAPDAAKQAQITPLQTRLASTVTEAGLPLRYSLNSQGRIKLLSGSSGALTLPSAQSPQAIAAAWLDIHRDLFDLSAQEIAFEDGRAHETSAGLRFVELERNIGGLPIFRSNIRIAIDPHGRIIQVQGGEDPPVAALVPAVDAGPAVHSTL